jgi:hypothetical protein
MGGDLIGYHVAYPVKEGWQIIEQQVKAIEAIIKTGGGWDKLLAEKCAPEIRDAVLDKLARIGAEADGSDLALDELLYIKDDLELTKNFKKPNDFAAHDLTWYHAHINGQEVYFLFAGEISWGDEPDGAGYTMLRALSRLGIEHLMYQAIKWGNKK